jgi:probable HAF family extracellular repeat protein
MTAFAALATPVSSGAQDQQDHHKKAHYSVKTLGTFGGTASAGNGINNRGWVTGSANLKGDQTQHAAIWLDGLRFDLGTLGGPNSVVQFPSKSDRGKIAGLAETSITDPLGEDFCQLKTGFTCQPFLWQGGVMTSLPTLGGSNGRAAGVNNHGQVIGWAENTIHDSTCAGKQVLQFEAVIWGPKVGQIQQLPPLAGDPDGAAVAINDKGQVVGISSLCDHAVGGLSAEHAVLWENGMVIDLGNFGGKSFNTAAAINSRGQSSRLVGLAWRQDFPRFPLDQRAWYSRPQDASGRCLQPSLWD